MHRFHDILYLERHLEGSSRACAAAVRLARANEARLTVAAVVSRDVELWEARMEEVAQAAGDEGVEVEVRLLGGEPKSAILGQVKREGHDLLLAVAETAPTPSLSRGHPVDRGLLRSLPCAVCLMAPAQSGPIRVVLAALRLQAAEASPLDRRILETATSLAGMTGARLHVAHFWGLVGESVLASPTRGVRRGRLGRVLEGVEEEQRRRLDDLLAEIAPDVEVEVTLAKGDAARGVARLARRIQADVVVAGNSARSGVEGVLFGNLTERLLGRITGAVLALRPEPRGDERRARGAARRHPPGGPASPESGPEFGEWHRA